jgi:hypothetical protein
MSESLSICHKTQYFPKMNMKYTRWQKYEKASAKLLSIGAKMPVDYYH